MRRVHAASWRRHVRRYIRSSQSGISPRCSVRSSLNCFSVCAVGFVQLARRAGFQRPSFDQRIGPLAQSGNVNVNPVVPPVERRGVIGKGFTFMRNQSRRKFLHIFCDEVMFVEQDKRLKEFNQFFELFQIAVRLRERHFFEGQRSSRTLYGLDNRTLCRRGHADVAFLGDGDGIEAQAQPELHALLRPIVLAMGQGSQLNGATHVARIRNGRRKLINVIMPAFDDRCRNQRHSATHGVNRDHIEALAFVAGQLPEIRAQKIRECRRSVDSFIPSAKWLRGRALHDCGPHNGKGQAGAQFRGWNEGINTSAALSYLLGTYFRQLPSNERKRLDVIPVDAVCRGMTLIAAAIVERRHDHVYKLATSVTNPCDMRRSIELTSLAHRKHYRAQEGMEFWLRLRFDAIPVSKERYNWMSAPAQRAIIKSIQRGAAPFPLKKMPLTRADRSLEKVEKLIELFEPFILLNEHDFVAENVEKLSYALVPEEQKLFGYDTSSLDWWDYWINIHIPALRKWTYPLIEGRPLEPRAPRNLHPANGVVVEEAKTGTNGATWRYS